MKKNSLYLLLSIALVACNGSDRPKEKTTAEPANTVTLTEKGFESELDVEAFEEAGPTSTYVLMEAPALKHPELVAWVEQFNGWALSYDIMSQVEKCIRMMGEGEKCASVIDSIRGFRIEGVLTAESKKNIATMQQDLAKNLEDVMSGQIECGDYWVASANKNGEALSDVLLELAPKGGEGSEDFVSLMYDWRELLESETWRPIAQAVAMENEEELSKSWPRILIEEKDIDMQCQLALCAANELPVELADPAMRYLMEQGRYSKHLFTLWFGWRTKVQVGYYGRSRDSVIADALYNMYRVRIFRTVLAYLDEHPDDLMAKWQLVYICDQDNIVRNGECIYGSDVNLDEDLIFGS